MSAEGTKPATPFRKRQLIARRNETRIGRDTVQIGYDVGWRVYGKEGRGVEIWWGNTKNARSFRSMSEDARRQGYEFDLDETAERLLRGEL
jgi:hypothetical protein